ncbi:hypothetical protein K2X40_02985 [Candidatus Babeliales bacterium]|nr:hypothetical protein [Candidatus Babeliales bacterium]
MIEEIKLWPNKLRDGLACAQTFIKQFGNKLPGRVHTVAFIGMGGSGIVGRMLKPFLDQAGVASTVIASSILPTYLDRVLIVEEADPFASPSFSMPSMFAWQTLAIVVSYSGNTWETLDALEQLIAKKVPTLVITHGGRALELAKEHGLPYVIVPESKTPRSALGTFLGFILALFEHQGLLHDGKKTVEGFIKQAEKNLPALTEKSYFEDFLAAVGNDEFFHIWGVSGESEAFAYRAQTQFNENAKVHAVSSAFPELCHNLIVGFTQAKKAPFVLFFYTNFLTEHLKKAVLATQELMQECGVNLYKPPILGDTLSDQLFNMVLWADCASYYLAQNRGIETAPVRLIDALKKKHQQKGIIV